MKIMGLLWVTEKWVIGYLGASILRDRSTPETKGENISTIIIDYLYIAVKGCGLMILNL